jgi:hypothetical protein
MTVMTELVPDEFHGVCLINAKDVLPQPQAIPRHQTKPRLSSDASALRFLSEAAKATDAGHRFEPPPAAASAAPP